MQSLLHAEVQNCCFDSVLHIFHISRLLALRESYSCDDICFPCIKYTLIIQKNERCMGWYFIFQLIFYSVHIGGVCLVIWYFQSTICHVLNCDSNTEGHKHCGEIHAACFLNLHTKDRPKCFRDQSIGQTNMIQRDKNIWE